MNTQNPKRPRHEVNSSIQNPNSIPVAPDLNQNEFDSIISSFILLPDPPSNSIDCSIDRVFGKVLSLATEASGDDSIQDLIIDRTNKLALLLQESTKRFSQMRQTLYNYNSWSLPSELTTKIFSMLDTRSLMKASACCTMFRQCSLDPLCYSHIDLKTCSNCISDEVVCSLILRAGKELRSLQLGRVTSVHKCSLVKRTCLDSIVLNPGFNGDLLRSLRLYNLKSTGTKSLCAMLSVCPNLTDLKIFNLHRKQIVEEVLKTLTKNPRLILERLFLHNSVGITASGASSSTAEAFVSSCPNLISLTLVGFDLKEDTARTLALGFPKLNYMNLSRTRTITGLFLSDMINSCRDGPLKILILRDCPCLDQTNVVKFLDSLIKGDFKFIRHIDLSHEHGYGRKEIVILKNLVMKLKEERSDVFAVA